MLIEEDYYSILEIEKSASKIEIKRAYKKLAIKYHPDKNQNNKDAEEKFKQINEAYQILSDDNKRAMYDRYGKDGLSGGFNRGGFGAGSIFDDIFGDFFGTNSNTRRNTNSDAYPLDEEITVDISFNEALFGCKKSVSYQYKTPCNDCNGTGAKDGKLHNCQYCEGQGNVFIRQGFMSIQQTCPKCNGVGKTITSKCSSCKGRAYKLKNENMDITIPEGIAHGNQMRVSGKANKSKYGNRGDLYITVIVEEDRDFVRDGDDIYLEVPIFFTSILLGASIDIPTPRGNITLKIPKGAKDKEHFRFKSQGSKNVNSQAMGDFIVQIKIIYPTKLTKEQQILIKQLDQSFKHSNNSSYLTNIFDRIKSWI